MSDRPNIPDPMKRQLRQEAYFGCVKCGCPIIEYHHIEPWSKVKKHEKDNLVVLCPNCHREANVGSYFKEQVIEDKKNPVNKRFRFVQNKIMLRKFSDIKMKLGGVEISGARNILSIYDMKLIYFNIDKDGKALLNAVFFDDNMRLIAAIKDNEWIAFLYKDMWDIQYSPGHLKINLKEKKVFLDLSTKGQVINVKTRLNVLGNKIVATEDKLRVNGATFVNCRFVGGGIGIG